jgi:hypothetical protein
MSSKKNPNLHARLIPQKCSLCNNPGHNRNSRDCPVNLFNVEKQQLINVHSAELARLLDIEQQLQLQESSSSSGDPSSRNEYSTVSDAPFLYLPPPQDKQIVDRMVADYERGLADREAGQPTVLLLNGHRHSNRAPCYHALETILRPGESLSTDGNKSATRVSSPHPDRHSLLPNGRCRTHGQPGIRGFSNLCPTPDTGRPHASGT